LCIVYGQLPPGEIPIAVNEYNSFIHSNCQKAINGPAVLKTCSSQLTANEIETHSNLMQKLPKPMCTRCYV
jgi:hypothetical protein